MCSWCWGFVPVWKEVLKSLGGQLEVQYVLGGLAVDTDETMPVSMQATIRETWHRIQQEIPGTDFNYAFWDDCIPRRSTYPACRAVIAAEMQDKMSSRTMLSAIQQAYYLRAKNPSDSAVLVSLAGDIGLDESQFERDMMSAECERRFSRQLRQAAELGVTAFPSLVLERDGELLDIPIDYNDSGLIFTHISSLL